MRLLFLIKLKQIAEEEKRSKYPPLIDFDPAMGRERELATFRKKKTAFSLISLTPHLAINFHRVSSLFPPFPYGRASQERHRELAGDQELARIG